MAKDINNLVEEIGGNKTKIKLRVDSQQTGMTSRQHERLTHKIKHDLEKAWYRCLHGLMYFSFTIIAILILLYMCDIWQKGAISMVMNSTFKFIGVAAVTLVIEFLIRHRK